MYLGLDRLRGQHCIDVYIKTSVILNNLAEPPSYDGGSVRFNNVQFSAE